MILVGVDGRFRFAGADVAVDRHGGDVAGCCDLGHGELSCVVHPLGFANQGGGHLRLAVAGAAPGAKPRTRGHRDQARTVRLSIAHARSLNRAVSWLRSERSWIIVAVTSRVDEAGTQGGQSTPAPQLVLGYVSLWHSIRAVSYTHLRAHE